MARQHDKLFKLDAIQYYEDHKDLGVRGYAENLGIGYSTLTKWLKDFRESGDISVRGSGNYASDEQKEIARLRACLKIKKCTKRLFISPFHGKIKKKGLILCQDVTN